MDSILTLRRPKITKNDFFSNRSKTSFNTLLELLENGFLGSQVVPEWFGRCLSSYTPPSAAVSNNYLHITVRNNDGNFWSMLSGLAEICDFCKLCEAVTFSTGIGDPSCYIFLKSSRRDLFKNMYFNGKPTFLSKVTV